MGRRGQRLTLVAMCLGLFLAQTDTTAVNLALPAIGRTVGGGVGALPWVVDGYNLAFAALLLTGGTLGDRLGRRRVYRYGLAAFVAGSVACAAAPSFGVLVAARGLQGVGAALAIPQSLAILSVVFPGRAERNRAMAAWSTVTGVAFAVGPTLGGVLVDRLGWASIFWLNVPVGLGTLALTLAAPESADRRARPVDVQGQLLAVVALGGLTFAVVESGGLGVASAPVLGAAAAGALALAGFVLVERRRAHPMLPLGLLRRGRLPVAAVVAACMTFGMYGMFMLISLDFQGQRGLGALLAGLTLMPLALVITFGSPFTGRLVTRYGPRPAMTGGMALMGLGLLAYAGLGGDGPVVALLAVFAVIGAGLALNTGPVVGVAVAAVEPDRAGLASGIANLARMTGATLGVAIMGAVLAAAGHGAAHGPGFGHGLRVALLVGAAVELTGAVVAYRGLARAASG